jgi:hypothetical protein
VPLRGGLVRRRHAAQFLDDVEVLGVKHRQSLARRHDLHGAEDCHVVQLIAFVGHEYLDRRDAALEDRGQFLEPFGVDVPQCQIERIVRHDLPVGLFPAAFQDLHQVEAGPGRGEVHRAGDTAKRSGPAPDGERVRVRRVE